MGLNKFSVVFLSAAVLLLAAVNIAEACVLYSSPWSYNYQDIFSSIFGCQTEEPQKLMYDRATERWVEKCPEITCDHGKDEGDHDVCPSCMLGPGAECGDWAGKCGNDMICQHSSMYSCSGKCVWEADFLSRKLGESCGKYEGECGNGLRCRADSSLWSFICGFEGEGVCVTEEQFSSRRDGETCGDSAGNCGEGLTCVESDYCWTQATCKNTTESSDSPPAQDEFVTIEIFNEDSEDSKGNGIVESLLEIEKEIIPGISSRVLAEEEKVIEKIFESAQKSNFSDGTEEIVLEIIEVPEKDAMETDTSIMTEDNVADKDIELDVPMSEKKDLKVVMETPVGEKNSDVIISDEGPVVFSSAETTKDEPMVLGLL